MRKNTIVYLVAAAAFFGPFTQTIYTPMLPKVQEQFQTSGMVINLSISIFTLFLALMQIVYGPLTDRVGRRKVLLPSILVYVAASVGVALSPSIPSMLMFRALQAVGIAAGSVVATTVIGDLFEGKQRGRAMGTFQMMVALGPVVGPVVGGFVGEQTGFHGVFWVLAISGLFLWFAINRFLPETKPETAAGPQFSIRDFGSVFQNRVGSAVVVLGFAQYFTFYNFLVFLPVILSSTYGLSTSQNGMVFLPMSLSVVVGSLLGGRFQERFSVRNFLLVAASLNVLATLLFALLAAVSLPVLISVIALFGICMGISLPVQTTMLSDAFQHNRATAIGVYNFLRYSGMAAGPLIGSLFTPLGHNMEFAAATVIFAAAVLFATRQFAVSRKEAVI